VFVLCYCISFHRFNVFIENFTSYVTLYLYVCDAILLTAVREQVQRDLCRLASTVFNFQ